jgi:hypothetical protein
MFFQDYYFNFVVEVLFLRKIMKFTEKEVIIKYMVDCQRMVTLATISTLNALNKLFMI